MDTTVRSLPIPPEVEVTAHVPSLANLQSHASYLAAKAGDAQHALQLVCDLALYGIYKTRTDFPKDCVFCAPHAREATGDNAIPQTLAEVYALVCSGVPDRSIYQVSKVYHTGANVMDRLLHPPKFDGDVVPGAQYVLVDDVTTIGNTLAELANYIQLGGGLIYDIAVLVDAGRVKSLHPDKVQLKRVNERFQDEIIKTFGSTPDALTANEVNYIVGFRDADELRARAAKAKQERNLRLRSKGLRDGGQAQN